MADLIGRISALLESGPPETRAAAAIVLGELECRDPAAVKALGALANAPTQGLRLAALGALEKIASPRALPALLQALDGPPEVGHAATRAIAALGEDVVPDIQARLKGASPGAAARLSQVLAQLVGKKSLTAMLDGFRSQDRDSVVKTTLAFRQEIRHVDPKERRALLPQVVRFLGAKRTLESEEATVGAIRVLGFLEDERAVEPLLALVGRKQATGVRIEALIALRFALGSRREAPEVVRALLPLLDDPDARVARTALDTLANLALPPSALPALERAGKREETDVAFAAIERLGALGASAAPSLVRLVLAAPEAKAQRAVAALGDHQEARGALLEATLQARSDQDRARLAQLLRPHARKLGEAAKEDLARAARARLRFGIDSASPLLALLQEADPARLAQALRDEATRVLGEKHRDAAQRLYEKLLQTEYANAADRLALARIELARSSLDLAPGSRMRDRALALFADAARRGGPVAEALEADKSLTPEQRFFVGFHLSELPEGEGRDIGHEILATLAKGRSKLARSAKNKLRLTGYEE